MSNRGHVFDQDKYGGPCLRCGIRPRPTSTEPCSMAPKPKAMSKRQIYLWTEVDAQGEAIEQPVPHNDCA